MKYTIVFSRSAEKQLEAVPKDDLKKIAKRIDKLQQDPFPLGHEKLSGKEDLYRIRQGNFRVIYSVEGKKLIILILKIGHRREIYRSF